MAEKKTGYNPDSMKDFEKRAMEGTLPGMSGNPQQQHEEDLQAGIQETEEALEQEVNYEDPPLDNEAPEGPTMADVELWKKQFPDCRIYNTTIVGEDFLFRTLTRAEYKQIAARTDLNALTREEVICKTCCLWPQLDAAIIGRDGAGVASTLAKLIMELSGFSEPEVVERLA